MNNLRERCLRYHLVIPLNINALPCPIFIYLILNNKSAIMSTTLRRPFVVVSALRQLPKSTQSAAVCRSFHSTTLKQSSRSGFSSSSIFSKSRATLQNAFRQSSKRNYTPQNPSAGFQAPSGDLKQRLLYGAGIFGATLVRHLCLNVIIICN